MVLSYEVAVDIASWLRELFYLFAAYVTLVSTVWKQASAGSSAPSDSKAPAANPAFDAFSSIYFNAAGQLSFSRSVFVTFAWIFSISLIGISLEVSNYDIYRIIYIIIALNFLFDYIYLFSVQFFVIFHFFHFHYQLNSVLLYIHLIKY